MQSPWQQSPKAAPPTGTFRPELPPPPWQVIPDYVYSNPSAAGHSGDIHGEIHPPHPYHQQPDMSRRHEHFVYGAPQPGADPSQHHPSSVPQVQQVPQVPQVSAAAPLNVPLQPQPPPPPPAVGTPQLPPVQAPPPPAPAPGGRQRKRPATGAAAPAQAGAAASNQITTAPPGHMAKTSTSSAPGTPGLAAPAPASGQPPAAVKDEDSAPQPPPKKSRTNTPWTPEEELRLKNMRDKGESWAEIAKTFPNRTEGSVKKHWYKDMHYAEFAIDEKEQLLQAIKEYEANKWKVIGQKLNKPAKACEQYAKEHFPQMFAASVVKR